MTPVPIEPPGETFDPARIVGHLQTDTFCEYCNYNLHTQAVVRDERLGILVCRCPECGRWASAGKGVSAASVWLNRFGTALLAVWVFFLTGAFALSVLFLGMLAFGGVQSQTYYNSEISYGNMPSQGRIVYTLQPHEKWDLAPGARRQKMIGTVVLYSIGTALSFLVGAMSAVFLWHVRNAARMLVLLVPGIALLAAAFFWINDPMAVDLIRWGVTQLVVIGLIDFTATLTGIATGRPIARLVLRLFVPPKPRQHLAFLWAVDGKHLSV